MLSLFKGDMGNGTSARSKLCREFSTPSADEGRWWSSRTIDPSARTIAHSQSSETRRNWKGRDECSHFSSSLWICLGMIYFYRGKANHSENTILANRIKRIGQPYSHTHTYTRFLNIFRQSGLWLQELTEMFYFLNRFFKWFLYTVLHPHQYTSIHQ